MLAWILAFPQYVSTFLLVRSALMRYRSLRFHIVALVAVTLVLVAASVRVLAAPPSSVTSPPSVPLIIDDATLKAMTSTIGGASSLPTTRTVQHWFGQTADP